MYCQNCGKELPEQASFCPSCGRKTDLPPASGSGARKGETVSPYSRLTALVLCIFLGGIGVHRFYVGKVGTGVAMIFTLGGLGIWWLVDFIMIAVGEFTDSEGRRVRDWQA
jgi:hypothetical protein